MRKWKSISGKGMAMLCAAAMMAGLLSGCGGTEGEKASAPKESTAPEETSEQGKESTEQGGEQESSDESEEKEGSADIVTARGELPIVTEPVTLKVAIPINSKVEDIDTNKLTIYIEEQTGIDLEFIELSSSDTDTQVNSIMNGSDLPDVFIGYEFDYNAIGEFAEAGLLAPLDEYVEKYGKNLQEVMLADPDIGEDALSYGSYDGHVYALFGGGGLVTNVYATYQSYIQTQFLEEMDMELPTTLDEFREYLSAVHKAHPEISPWTSYKDNNYIFANISQAFQYTDIHTYLKVDNGKVEFIGNNENFKKALQYGREMVDEGLIDVASFTQDSNVLATQLAQDGLNMAAIGCGNMFSNVMDSEGEEYQSLKVIGLLEGPDGYVSAQLSPPKVSTSMVVTTACEHPDVAFRLFDYFLSDEFAICARVGFEGEQWEKAADGAIGRDGEQAWFTLLTAQEWVQPSTNVIWDMENFIHRNIMNHCEASAGVTAYPTSEEIVKQKVKEANTKEYLPQMIMDAEDGAEYREIRSLIVDSVNQNVVLFLLGDRSLDEFDTYCSELEAMGVERYVELAQKAYDVLTQ